MAAPMKKFVPGLSFIKQSVILQNLRKFAVSLPVIFLKKDLSIKLDYCYVHSSKCDLDYDEYFPVKLV